MICRTMCGALSEGGGESASRTREAAVHARSVARWKSPSVATYSASSASMYIWISSLIRYSCRVLTAGTTPGVLV
jgi:hypothetical protein